MFAFRVIPVLLAALLLVGCAADEFNDDRGWGDAPVGDRDDGPADVINFPDQFHNWATKCDHGNRLYSHTRESAAPVVVPSDPSCEETRSPS